MEVERKSHMHVITQTNGMLMIVMTLAMTMMIKEIEGLNV